MSLLEQTVNRPSEQGRLVKLLFGDSMACVMQLVLLRTSALGTWRHRFVIEHIHTMTRGTSSAQQRNSNYVNGWVNNICMSVAEQPQIPYKKR